MTKQRNCHLTTIDLYRLDRACLVLTEAFGFGCTYLVGSVSERDDFRDVDVRTILDDDEFDRLFGGNVALWEAINLGIGCWLTTLTSLPVDYQIQRMTEANAKHGGKRRNLLGIGPEGRRFAGGGDATNF